MRKLKKKHFSDEGAEINWAEEFEKLIKIIYYNQCYNKVCIKFPNTKVACALKIC